MQHKKYIARCLELAANGIGTARPNPSVGAVVVYNDRIIGEGYTDPYGGPHAEVNAIGSVEDITLLKSATLYVTLEPCSHYGKTPPCADLIIKHEIPNVVIGCLDTNELVAGKGIERLRNAGCNVIVGVLEEECLHHHRRFFTNQDKKRPFIILKWAETKDGFIAPLNRDEQKPVWITNEKSRQMVHKWRAEEHAILVGTNTVREDNPKLTIRNWSGENPIRIVLDRQLKLSKDLNVFDGSVLTIVLTEKERESSEYIQYERIDFSKDLPWQISKVLYKHKIQSVIIEGGAKTLQSFIDADLWDEANVFIGAISFQEGIKAPVFDKKTVSEEQILQDILKKYKND